MKAETVISIVIITGIALVFSILWAPLAMIFLVIAGAKLFQKEGTL